MPWGVHLLTLMVLGVLLPLYLGIYVREFLVENIDILLSLFLFYKTDEIKGTFQHFDRVSVPAGTKLYRY